MVSKTYDFLDQTVSLPVRMTVMSDLKAAQDMMAAAMAANRTSTQN